MPRILQITPYNPRWPDLFRQEARQIFKVLSGQIILIHHIGSTAIAGIKAKPIIDFLIEVHQIESVDAYSKAMITLGYDPRGENGIHGRRYFVKGTAEVHSHHLHVFQVSHPDVARHLDFRDYLRTYPDQAQTYSQLKEMLASKYHNDPVAYTDGKTKFIREIDKCAAIWRVG